MKDQNNRPRLLGRGVPPSQPIPRYLAPSARDRVGDSVAPRIVIACAVGLGILIAVVAIVLSWNTVFAPAPLRASPHLSLIGQSIDGTEPVDLVLAIGDSSHIKAEGVSVERVWIDACQRPGSGRTPPENCDRQPFFERALVKTILGNSGCAPERPKDETISYALEVHYRHKRVRLFAGKSGSLNGKAARTAVQCIEPKLPKPDWDSLEHEHSRYIVAVLASYPAEKRQ